MSTHTHAHNARLRQLSGSDPTGTAAIRRNFVRAARRRFRRLRGRTRSVAGYEEDRLHLRQGARLAEGDPENIERFPTDGGKRAAFITWLKAYLAEEVLQRVPAEGVAKGAHWTSDFIRAAYRTGYETARGRLGNEGVAVGGPEENPLQLGVAQSTLRQLYQRTYGNLTSVTDDAVAAVRDELTRGLAEGVNPREMARRLSKEIRTIQRTQAEVLARTEVINAHTQATLSRYDEANVGQVTVSGEFTTAQDDRVCPVCESIAGEIFELDALRGDSETFTFEPAADEPDHLAGEYRIAPPVHPRCRCAVLPVIA